MHPTDDGTPIAVAALRNLRPAVDRVIAVVRPAEGALARALRDDGADILFFAEAHKGMGNTLAYGVAHTDEDEALIIALADMPGIAPETIHDVVKALRSGSLLARPCYNGQPGHPVGFAPRFRPALMELSGDSGAKAILDSNLNSLNSINTHDSGVLWDVDRPDDLIRQRP
ncbi:MAG: nucleotidyltransferase family protein [Gammaproteobacteria bacterium]|nr:nucleotidyltransferase family protein [Gammaproteobacteria bacterium]